MASPSVAILVLERPAAQGSDPFRHAAIACLARLRRARHRARERLWSAVRANQATVRSARAARLLRAHHGSAVPARARVLLRHATMVVPRMRCALLRRSAETHHLRLSDQAPWFNPARRCVVFGGAGGRAQLGVLVMCIPSQFWPSHRLPQMRGATPSTFGCPGGSRWTRGVAEGQASC